MILADTHAWLWWLSDRERLSPTAREALEANQHAICPMTFWEIAMLSNRKRIELTAPPLEWLKWAVEQAETILLPITAEIGVLAGTLRSNLIRDPADRLIVATAMHHKVPLVTKDGDIRNAQVLKTIW